VTHTPDPKTPEQPTDPHVCQPLEVDGMTVSVRADPNLTDREREALAALVRAAVKMHGERTES